MFSYFKPNPIFLSKTDLCLFLVNEIESYTTKKTSCIFRTDLFLKTVLLVSKGKTIGGGFPSQKVRNTS